MIWISRVMLLFTLSWGFTYFLCKFKHFWLNFAFQIFWNCYRFVGVSYDIFLFCIFVFSCALLSCSFLKCWLNLQNPISLSWQILHLFFWCSKIHFLLLSLQVHFSFLPGICYFLLTDQTHFGQRQSWHRERATLDQQMYTNMCNVKMSNIVLPLFSHHKTNPTDSHQLSQIVPVRQKIL